MSVPSGFTTRSIAIGSHETMSNPAMNCYRTKDDRWVWLLGLEAAKGLMTCLLYTSDAADD